MSLSNDQFLLLTKISQYSDTNRRTDRLAACMAHFKADGGKKWDIRHTPYVGLQLRALGLVTTFKDTSQYALWNITPVGKAKLLEESQRRYRVAQEKDTTPANSEPAKPVQWAVFSESDSGFQRCANEESAEALARKWVVEADEDAVHIIQIVKTLKAKVVVEEV